MGRGIDGYVNGWMDGWMDGNWPISLRDPEQKLPCLRS